MKEYTREDGKGMKWNVLSVPRNESVLKTFPSLARMFEDMFEDLMFQGSDFEEDDEDDMDETAEMTADQIVRYIVLVYHIKSPLIQDEEDIMWRKKRAMQIIGIETDSKGYFTNWINTVIANRNPNSVNLIMRFLKFEENLDWLELCSLTELLWDYQRVISEESVGKGNKSSAEVVDKKLAARAKTTGLRTEMKALSTSIFRGDHDLLNYVGSTVAKEEIRLRLTPESRAR